MVTHEHNTDLIVFENNFIKDNFGRAKILKTQENVSIFFLCFKQKSLVFFLSHFLVLCHHPV